MQQLRLHAATTEEIEVLLKRENEGNNSLDGGAGLPPNMISKRNEIQAYKILQRCVEQAIQQTQKGIEEATFRQDTLIQSYLNGRYETLSKALYKIQITIQYPDIILLSQQQ